MRKNFIAMPPLLKLLTTIVVGVPIFCIATAFPHQSISVFGRQMTSSEWWSSGTGPTTLVVGGVMVFAALLMLRRSRYGRLAYLLGLMVLSLSEPVIAYFTGSSFSAEIPPTIFDLLFTALIGLYLYKSGAVQNYFMGALVSTDSG